MPGHVYTGTAAALPREKRFGGKYERTGLVMDSANMCFVWLDPAAFADVANTDGSAPCHAHPFDMLIYVIKGDLRFTTDGKEHYLSGGDFIYVPRDVEHGGRPSGDKPVHLIEIFAPIRTDYLYVAEHQLSLNQTPRDADGSRNDTRSFLDTVAAVPDARRP